MRNDWWRGVVYWHGCHMDTGRRIEIMVWSGRVRIVRLLSEKVAVVSIRDRYCHRGMVLIRMLGSRILRGWPSQRAWRMRTMLVFGEGRFAAEAE